MKFRKILKSFLDLFFPPMCIGCEERLTDGEKYLCLHCLSDLPKTNYYKQPDNPNEQLFAGRIPFVRIASHMHFVKGGTLQKVIHELKYKNNPQIGIWLGQMCGNDLKGTFFLKTVDYIVPIPLHRKRQRKRGYNQSAQIAEGLAEVTGIAACCDNVIRAVNNKSQTRKTKSERLKNVSGIFEVKDPSLFTNKHILLIDDLVTTGATLEECAKTILQSSNAKISIFTIGSAL